MFRVGVVVSSHGNPPTFNPFGRDERFLRDLLRFKRAFVQHGVMNTTQCQWCGREAINLSLLTTTARREYEMMLSAPIGYTDGQVRLTGMPRYDRLTPRTGDTIVLMPTWRKGLLDEVGQLGTFGERAAAFAASVFASEWRAIAESEEAARLKQSHGVKLTLVWHPQIHSAFRRWSGGSEAKVEALLGREPNDFETLKNTAALLVTDYSSISFDFAYLGKPVAYYQFDADKMLTDRTYHRYRPDFDFAGEGFGPVIRSRGDVLRWIVEAVEGGGGMKEPFRTRAAQFFRYRDKNNCQRVWSEIVRLTSGGQARPLRSTTSH
jgi:CDP-glycerol glycerophosphotransferase (TagB/SpsB family)